MKQEMVVDDLHLHFCPFVLFITVVLKKYFQPISTTIETLLLLCLMSRTDLISIRFEQNRNQIGSENVGF